jgi:hypothetical protein
VKRFDGRMAFVPEGQVIVARHEVPGSDAERPSSRRDGRSHCQSHRYLSSEIEPRHEQSPARRMLLSLQKRQVLPVEKFGSDGIGSIVPLGRRYFPHDSRHFVPGYDRTVPPGQNHSPIEAPLNYLSAYGLTPPSGQKPSQILLNFLRIR